MIKTALVVTLILSIEAHAGLFFGRRRNVEPSTRTVASTKPQMRRVRCPHCGRWREVPIGAKAEGDYRDYPQRSLPAGPNTGATSAAEISDVAPNGGPTLTPATAQAEAAGTTPPLAGINSMNPQPVINHQIHPEQLTRPAAGGANYIQKRISIHSDCEPEYFDPKDPNSRFVYHCPDWFGAQLLVEGKRAPHQLDELSSNYSMLIKEHNQRISINPTDLLPGYQAGFSTMVVDRPNVISVKGADGKHKARIIEVDVSGKLGKEVRVPGTRKETIRNTFNSRFFIKIGETPDETCIIAATGIAPPETASIGRGFHFCEYVNNSSPRLRTSIYKSQNEGEKNANKIRESLLEKDVSCKQVNIEQIRRDALNLPPWPAPEGPLKEDPHWFFYYCARNGMPNPRLDF